MQFILENIFLLALPCDVCYNDTTNKK